MFWIDRNRIVVTLTWHDGHETYIREGKVLETLFNNNVWNMLQHQVENIIGKVFEI